MRINNLQLNLDIMEMSFVEKNDVLQKLDPFLDEIRLTLLDQVKSLEVFLDPLQSIGIPFILCIQFRIFYPFVILLTRLIYAHKGVSPYLYLFPKLGYSSIYSSQYLIFRRPAMTVSDSAFSVGNNISKEVPRASHMLMFNKLYMWAFSSQALWALDYVLILGNTCYIWGVDLALNTAVPMFRLHFCCCLKMLYHFMFYDSMVRYFCKLLQVRGRI